MSKADSIVRTLLEDISAEQLKAEWDADQAGDYIRVDKERGTAAYLSRKRLVQQIKPVQGNIWLGIKQWLSGKPHMLRIWSVDGYHNATLQDGQGGELGTTA